MIATICGNGRTVYSAFGFMTAKNTDSYIKSFPYYDDDHDVSEVVDNDDDDNND